LISDDIHKVLNLSDFHFFVDFIKKYENIDSIIIDNTIKKYIDEIILREKSISIHESHNFEILENSYPHLVKYRDDRKHELLVETTQEGLIAKTLEKSLRGWGEKDQYILNNHLTNKGNYADALIVLASLEIHLKNGLKI
jgi:hypothetical protein